MLGINLPGSLQEVNINDPTAITESDKYYPY